MFMYKSTIYDCKYVEGAVIPGACSTIQKKTFDPVGLQLEGYSVYDACNHLPTAAPASAPINGNGDASSSSSSLSDGAIAGIVIGSVAGAALLLGLLAYTLMAQKPKPEETFVPVESADPNAKV